MNTTTKLTAECQCCGRQIGFKSGVIAHHGYRRPSSMPGWQTASCMGARFAPFHVSRDRLGDMLRAMHAEADKLTKRIMELRADKAGLTLNLVVARKREAWGKTVDVTKPVTKDTFEAISAEHGAHFRSYSLYSWEAARMKTEKAIEGQLRAILREIDAQQARYDAWQPA